jgi:hypothetical protein
MSNSITSLEKSFFRIAFDIVFGKRNCDAEFAKLFTGAFLLLEGRNQDEQWSFDSDFDGYFSRIFESKMDVSKKNILRELIYQYPESKWPKELLHKVVGKYNKPEDE